ncbi:MAG: rhomboid family intramembrane serine protease [Bacteroidia bacterium]
MFKQYRPPSASVLPPAVKNLLIINGLFFLATYVLRDRNVVDLTRTFGLFFPLSQNFKPFQLFTYMFMHADFFHIFFNMLSLFMFGTSIENFWGWKRFSFFYVATALGGATVYLLVKYIEIYQLKSQIPLEVYNMVLNDGSEMIRSGYNYTNTQAAELNLLINIPVIGASGAVYGVLLAFGMMFPNTEIMMLMFPVPIKAKYLVFIMGGMELLLGINNSAGDNVAHFAHLGGMLFGFILVKYWNKTNRDTFY